MAVEKSDAALALAVVALIPSIYGTVLPSLSDVRSQADDRGHLTAGEQYAAVLSGAIVLGAAGVTRSGTVALAGTIAVVAYAAATHYAVRANP